MNISGISSPIVASVVTQQAVAQVAVPVTLPIDTNALQGASDSSSATDDTSSSQTSYDTQAVEQKHQQIVQQRSQEQNSVYVVSDHEFSIFKDSTGHEITRYVSLRDGTVTYVPKPQSFKTLSAATESVQPLIKIKA